MAQDYNPRDAVQVWPAGTYPGTLIEVKDGVSKVKPDGSGGNPMEIWKFRIYHEDGSEQVITDYVAIPKVVWKIKQLAIALGRKDEFEAGNFHAEDHINADIEVDLIVDQQPGFEESNKIKKIKGTAPSESQRQAAQERPQTQNADQRAAALSAMRPAPSQKPDQPFGSEEVFNEADIPFAWCDPRTAL